MPTSPYDISQPQLGYGNTAKASIDSVNQWMRSTPWYQAKLKSWGQSPDNVHLSDWQKQDLIKTAQQNGVIVDEGHDGQQIDDSGNFETKGHGLRNTLIVAGIAAAALATAGAAGVIGGGAASASAGAGTAATAGAAGTGATVGTGAAVAGGASVLDNILKYGVPVAGNLAGNLIQSNASGKASDAQQKYLEEALAYQKEQDAYNRTKDQTRYDYSKNTEAARYGDYSNRIAPYVATGSSANARMAALLGLPANAPLTAAPQPPIAAPTAPASALVGTQPLSRTNIMGGVVTIQAPDGSTRQVPLTEKDHWVSKGGIVTGQAA